MPHHAHAAVAEAVGAVEKRQDTASYAVHGPGGAEVARQGWGQRGARATRDGDAFTGACGHRFRFVRHPAYGE